MVQIAGCAERWDRVGVVAPEEWHTAIEAVSAAAAVISPGGEPLIWIDEACALAAAQQAGGSSLGIRIRGFTAVLLDEHGQLLKTLPLTSLSAEDAAEWFARRGFGLSPKGDFPEMPSVEALVNLDRAVSNAHETIGHIARVTHGSTPVGTDAATLETSATIELSSREGEPPRRILLGFTPAGDQGEIFVRTDPGERADSRLPLGDVAELSDVHEQAMAIELFLRESLEKAYASQSREWRSRRPPKR